MSLVIGHAYRYPIDGQSDVQKGILKNTTDITRELFDAYAARAEKLLTGVPRDQWLDTMVGFSGTGIDADRVRQRLFAKPSDDRVTAGIFVRNYLAEDHNVSEMMGRPRELFQARAHWTYVWSSKYGYVVLSPPSGIGAPPAESMVAGLDLEPFSYDGRVHETNHPSFLPQTVCDVWLKVLGPNDSVSDIGATSKLSDIAILIASGVFSQRGSFSTR